MTELEQAAVGLNGHYRDVLRGPDGKVIWDRGWQKNAIVANCRVLLAAFMRGDPVTAGITGLQVGAGLAAWDVNGPPLATPGQQQLVDQFPATVPPANFQISFLNGGAVVPNPTSRVQIRATFGRPVPPGVPPWPDGNHLTADLREFGLVGTLAGNPTLINYVTHPVIALDPASTLERTIWLQF
jgi:hypothetical protein